MRSLSPRLRILLGIFALIVGVAGLVLPILQGWLFLAIGLLLLSKDLPFFKKIQDGLERRFPRLAKMGDAVKKKFSRE